MQTNLESLPIESEKPTGLLNRWMRLSKAIKITVLVGLALILGIIVFAFSQITSTLGTPGIDHPLKYQEGSIRVKGVEKKDSFTQFGQTARARDGYTLVFVDLVVDGSVPAAGVTKTSVNLMSGAWSILDSNGEQFKSPALVSGKLVFQVKKASTNLTLCLGNDVKIPLASILK